MGQMKRYSQFLKELPSKTVVLAFGRFNPPTIGHELLIKAVKKVAKTHNADHSIYASKTTDTKKNPLTVDKKVKYLKLMFPGTNFVAANDQERTFLEAAKHLNKKYKNLIMVAGSDRVQEFTRLLNTYNGKEFKYDTVEVVSAGERDPDADDASGMSASKMRALASKGDYSEFKKGLPSSIRDIDGRRLMNDVRQGMGLDMVKEDIILVKDTLREQYFLGDIFNVGDIVESSGVKYEIVKRGSNHLLLKEESGKLVSKWIQDVNIAEDVQPGIMLNQYKDKGAESVAEETMKTEPKSYKDFVSDLRTDIEDPFTNTPVQDQPETGLVGHTLHSEPLDTYMRHRKVKYQLGEGVHPAIGYSNPDRTVKKGPESNPFRKQKTAADIEKIKKAKADDAKKSAKAQGGIYKKQSNTQRNQTVKGYMDLLKQIGESSSKLSSQRETSTPVYDAHIKGNSDYSSIVKKHGSNKTREIIHGLSKERDSLRKHSGEWAGPAHVRNHDFAIRGLKKAIGEEVVQESGGPVVFRKGNDHIEKYDDSFALYKNGKKSKYYKSIEDAKSAMSEEVELDESHVEFRIDHRQKVAPGHEKTFKDHDAKVSEVSDKATYVKVPADKANSFKAAMKSKHNTHLELGEEASFIVKEGYDELQSADYKTDSKGKKHAARHIVFKNGEEESDEEKAKHQREQIELEEKKRIKETPVKDDSAQLGDEEDKGNDAFFEEEEFDIEDMSDDELDKMAGEIEDEDDIMDEYEDDEFSIVDDETGEELPEDEDEKEIKEAALYEVLSRMERMRAKARMRRTKAKRERATKIALKRYSSNPTINKRSRRLAIKLMKKRLLRGRDPSKISVGEKERIERVIEKRKKIIGRLAMRLAPRVRKIEKARLSHTKFTQGAPNVAF
jgi:nicotinic acid mononucleotide adenylyltransferase